MSQKYLPSTSRDLDPTNYAWDSVVYQAGRPMLDSELNLTQDILNKKNTLPSGVLSYQGGDESIGSFVFKGPTDPNFTANSFIINPFKAMVNGIVVDVRNTNATDGTNKIVLDPPEEGNNNKKIQGDFVFLEVWRREITPSMNSKSRVKIISPLANETFTFSKDGVEVELVVGIDFSIGNSLAETARNIATAINNYDGADQGLTVSGVKTTVETRGTEFLFLSHTGGADGNHPTFTITSSDTGIRVLNLPAGGSDGEGMSSGNEIFFAGNVLAPQATDLPDKIQDPNVSVSSTRRIQVQYRIRHYSNEDVSNQIFGFEETDILAQGSKGSPVANYNFERHDTDTGLWYAGSGSSSDADALGTVDGYVYAIPLCYVFRRYAATGGDGFNPFNYFNTGVLHDHNGVNDNIYVGNVGATKSDRPDGLFADEIAEPDVLDLRRRVYPRGIDFTAELEYQYHSLLDNTNKTWYAQANNLQDTGNGSGGASHSPLVCDVFGVNDPAVIKGVGEHIRTLDHVARRWTNKATTERIYIVAKPPNSAQTSSGVSVVAGGGTGNYWYQGDIITIDLTTLKVDGSLLWEDIGGSQTFQFWAGGAYAPKIIDIGYCWHNDGNYNGNIEQQVRIVKVEGLGGSNASRVEITLDANPIMANGGISGAGEYKLVGDSDGESTGSEGEIFIELIFDYPSFDRGLSGTVAEVPTPDASGYPTGPAVVIESSPANSFDPYVGKGNGNAPPITNILPNTREVSLEYVCQQETIDIVSSTNQTAFLPWRLYYNSNLAPTITDLSGTNTVLTLDNSNTKYQHAETKVSWSNSGPGWGGGQRKIRVQAHPLEPFPADNVTNSTILVFYRRHAPKTIGAGFPIATPINVADGGVVPDELNLQPLAISKEINLYLKTSENYPFYNPTDELATHNNATYLDYKTLGSPEVILDDLKINTGSVSLPSFVPFVASVNVALGDNDIGQPPRKDNRGRVFYPTMEESSYFPSAFAKSMSGVHESYKTTLPCLMKVVDDNHILYRKGEVVLVVFVKTNEWGQGVSVDMRENLAENYVATCVYRTRNQLLLGE